MTDEEIEADVRKKVDEEYGDEPVQYRSSKSYDFIILSSSFTSYQNLSSLSIASSLNLRWGHRYMLANSFAFSIGVILQFLLNKKFVC